MNITLPLRVSAFLTAPLFLAMIWSGQPAQASSITLEWAETFNDKVLFIESSSGDRLFEEKLAGDKLKVDAGEMLREGVPFTAAVVGLEGMDELAIGVNLFVCSMSCDFRIAFAVLEARHSRSVTKICQANPKPIDSQFKKYFFCRDVFQRISANNKCWPETLSALTGWFEAAYKLHESTLRDGIGFVARDLEVESQINSSLESCPEFEKKVKRNPGYFRGMMKNLDVAILQQTQRVQRWLASDRPVEAHDLAANIILQLKEAEPIRDVVSSKEAIFVESVVNRALARNEQFVLR